MWKLKSCPRCGGDVYVDLDQYGWYEQCIQCSYYRDLQSTAEVQEEVSEGNLGQAKRTSNTSKVSAKD